MVYQDCKGRYVLRKYYRRKDGTIVRAKPGKALKIYI